MFDGDNLTPETSPEAQLVAAENGEAVDPSVVEDAPADAVVADAQDNPE